MASLRWIDQPPLEDRVALVAFEGWGDAGESASQAAMRFLEVFESEEIATFDPEEHFDFQVRRPIVVLEEGGTRRLEWPETRVHAVRTGEDELVLVIGEEPNYKWRAFTTELVEALQTLGVTRVVTLGAFIGQVAHTLPVPLIGTASRPEMLSLHGLLPSGYEGPTGILGVLNQALTMAGIDVISVWAAVPHYLSNQDYPPATEALAIKASELLGLTLDVAELTSRARQFRSTVDEAIGSNAELRRYVEQLEGEAVEEERGQADRLVEEIEDFLKDR